MVALDCEKHWKSNPAKSAGLTDSSLGYAIVFPAVETEFKPVKAIESQFNLATSLHDRE